jgi:hypothetical protein
MSEAGSGKFQLALLAAAIALLISPAASYGYTDEEQQACSGDAFRLCGPDIPDVDRITACMIRKQSELSPACRVFFRPEPDPPSAVGAPLSISPVAARKPLSAKHKPNRPARRNAT